jgi:hypothetical protein
MVAAPALAQERSRRRPTDERAQPRQAPADRQRAQPRERAVPRAIPAPSQQESRRSERNDRNDRNDRYDRDGRNGRYETYRPGYGGYYGNRRYYPRVIRPTVVRVIPYRPYVYRPSYRAGVYYGSGGYYPYGYTPRGYFDPIPGRPYGGVRITGVPRDARVFADGYYVGIVNDFDGIFQHLNLEAGPHHIEIDLGYDAIKFNVFVRPGETTTFRGDGYRY